MEWFFKTLPEDIQSIIHLGDLYDRRKYLNYVTANSARKSFLEPASQFGVPVWILAGNHDCLDTQTECLTKRGWKKYSEILDDDLILSKNGDRCEWSPINKKLIKYYEGDMISLKSRDIDMLVTPNHRVLLLRATTLKEKYFTASNLPAVNHWAVASSANTTNNGVNLSDDEIRHFAKEIPNWAHDLSSHQFDVFLNAIVDGDGCWDGLHPEKKTCAVVYGTKQFIEELQGISVQHGWRSKVHIDVRGNYVLRLCKTEKAIMTKSPEKIPYRGIVWCLNVPLGNFMVRRNGCAYFTGNCYHTNTIEINSLSEMVDGRYVNINIVTQPKEIEIDGTVALLLPWINQSNMENCFNYIKTSKASILMAHLELNGFEMHKGSVMDHGMDIPDLARFDSVYSGHYHHKSVRDNINYLGAFADYMWSDFNDPRGYHILETKTGELTFFQNPYSIHQMVVYDDRNFEPTEILNNTDYSKFANTFVQIVCVNRTNPYVWDQFLDNITKVGPVDISIIQDIESIKDNSESTFLNEAEDTLTILDQYISGLTIPVDSNKMKKYMRELYNEAISIEHVD